MRLNKVWMNKTGSLTFEVRECIKKNVLSYRYYIINEDGNETLKGVAGTKATAVKWLKKEYDIEGMFKTKKKPRKKVNAVKVEYDGYKFDSMTERDFYIMMSNTKHVSNIELHKTYHLLDGYEIASIVNQAGKRKVRKKSYTPDLVCDITGVGKVAFDVKGSKMAIPRDFSLRKHLFEVKYGIQLVVAIYNKKSKVWDYS
ncbi:hypothetical protein CN512_10780 [Bacillus cereus]|uniref:DUF1064 domain-containing protein n=1 Tax=Bacillus cereus TaxID=1396 RepID=UPI000BFA1A53|nr:DUF1064 domain-containing protein [Bacillus cereus]PES69804.1 hypothetical protein CN512_10780 [Bacillus cereus]